MADKKKDDLAKVDDLEIKPLSDQDLDSVAGGAEPTSTSFGCSCQCCFGGTRPADSDTPIDTSIRPGTSV